MVDLFRGFLLSNVSNFHLVGNAHCSSFRKSDVARSVDHVVRLVSDGAYDVQRLT